MAKFISMEKRKYVYSRSIICTFERFSIVEASLQSICRLMGCNNFINMISSYNQSENVFFSNHLQGKQIPNFL